jgi:hypothetical protein
MQSKIPNPDYFQQQNIWLCSVKSLVLGIFTTSMYDHAAFISFKGLYIYKTSRIRSSLKYEYEACSLKLVSSNNKDYVYVTGESVSRNQEH